MDNITFVIKGSDSVCEVHAGANMMNELVTYLKEKKAAKYIIITDSNVKKFHGDNLLKEMLAEKLSTILISFKAGEASKTRETKAFVEDKMLESKCGRDSLVIALGGGVVGDLAGFVAGTYMRGVPLVQVPTTTIAIGDSSCGGKTAIDTPAGKNMIGVFHHPVAVFMDAALLKTLDERNYINGLVEIVKHGLIKDTKFYEFLKNNMETIISRKGKDYNKVMEKVILNSIKIKQEVVAADPTEKNLRKILNYGHTIGHALEQLSNYSLLHGEAVAIGICVEAFLATKQGILSEQGFMEQKKLFQIMGLSTSIPKNIKTEEILSQMMVDKKARNSAPEFSLIKAIGQYAIFDKDKTVKAFDLKDIKETIEEYKRLGEDLCR